MVMKRWLLFVVLLLSVAHFSFIVSADDVTGNTYVDFFTGTQGYTCVHDSYSAYWRNDFTNPLDIVWIYSTSPLLSVPNACNNVSYADTWCCPVGFAPFADGYGDYECATGITGTINDCTGITEQIPCDTANSALAVNLIESLGTEYIGVCSVPSWSDGYCTNLTFCSCVWNSSANGGKGLCSAQIKQESCCGDINPVTGNCNNPGFNNCNWVEEPGTREDRCGDPVGQITIHLKATGTSAAVPCVDKLFVYPCSVSVKLPFFDKFSFIFAGLAIALVYFVIRKK
jgi:hypothetical protein